MKNNKEITRRADDYSQWYLDVIAAAGLADNSPVRGCMVIRPSGYAIWERIQSILDGMFKKTGVENAYFPLLIPISFLAREAEHVEGFAKECAVVTHHRLETDSRGNLVPAGRLEEPFIIRPTSETIMYEMYSKWIKSHRDLPLLINQWCNIMRWELRTRPFLRTTEFLWQEGHTVHSTHKESLKEVKRALDMYVDFFKNFLAIDGISGKKSEAEKFPGAKDTYTYEMLMPDNKALQGCTSHDLGQNLPRFLILNLQLKMVKKKYPGKPLGDSQQEA